MLGATATLIMAGLGMAGEAINAVKANKQQKAAAAAGKKYAADIAGIEEQNKMASLQSSDISKLKNEQTAGIQAGAIQAMQEMGPEGAAQASAIVDAGNKDLLRTAELQGKQDMGVQETILGVDQYIEEGRVQREGAVAWAGLEQSRKDVDTAQANKNSAISGMFDMAGLGIEGIDKASKLYGKNKDAESAQQFSNSIPQPGQWFAG